YSVDTAATGAEAIDSVKRSAPDVVVMDLSLPAMSGTDITRLLKADPVTRHIPVLAVSAHADESHAQSAYAAGVDDYCEKPCPPEELERRIRQLLDKKHR